jgi:hypothetical protein
MKVRGWLEKELSQLKQARVLKCEKRSWEERCLEREAGMNGWQR